MHTDISRRDFIGTGVAAGAGALAAGLLSGCSSANNAPNSTSATTNIPSTWDKEADIVVIGIGSAGIGAAYEAASSGASVIVLEKMDEGNAGGDSTCFGGAFSPYTAEVLQYYSLGTMDSDMAALRADTQKEMVELVSGWGASINQMGIVDGGAPKFYEIIKEQSAKSGYEVCYETPAQKLIFDNATSEVKGVQATQNGATINVKAKKGVIVTSGDYTANLDMVHAFNWPGMMTVPTGSPANTGDGLTMCTAVGAELKHLNKGWEWNEFCFRTASEELGCGVLQRWYSTLDFMTGTDSSPLNDSKVFVNMKGQRFMNEKQILSHDKSSLAFQSFKGGLFDQDKGYMNLPCWMVCDDTHIKSGSLTAVPGDPASTWAWTHSGYEWSSDNSAEVEKGWILKADTIEELAAKMTSTDYLTYQPVTMDASALAATIETYNAMCASGTADPFGRASDRCKPIVTPPYYAVELCPASLYSIGGVVTDINGSVLDWSGAPISRLYAAGNVGQDLELGPCGVCGCMGDATIAARYAITMDAWE